VKHFSWVSRGKARLHKKPDAREVAACGRWLEAELGAVRPKVVVCLGATAAKALLGGRFGVLAQLGSVQTLPTAKVIATYHPSAVLRMPDPGARRKAMAQLEGDLRRAMKLATDLRGR
jgi:DNA polymerase